ncbi:amidase [Janibacter sp. GS2]|uniref:amidase n=1 Tax=Janibacter sp. GS2 TaxID=3442646 RepID=UPI003EBBB6E1
MDESSLKAVADRFGLDTRDRTRVWQERLAQDEPLFDLVRSWEPADGPRSPGGRSRAATVHRFGPTPPSWALQPGETMASRVEEALSIIEANPDAHAFTCVFADEARAAARRLDERARTGGRMGALYGATVAVKDVIGVGGRSVTGGTRALETGVAECDAEAVRRLRAADGVLIGMTNLHALAYGPFSTSSDSGSVRNPLRPEAVAGGSSGGSAAAVAMGAVDLALGTDTAGSIRIPSALCGVVGLKGTYGRAPMDGVCPLAPTLDHVGPIAATVHDAAVGWGVLTGAPHGAAMERRESLEGVVIGDLGDDIRTCVDASVLAALDSALATAVRLGAIVRPVSVADLGRAPGAMLCTIGPEALDVHGDLLRARASALPEDVRLRLEAGLFVPAVDYVRAQRLRARLGDQLSHALTEVDVVLLPTVPIIAPAADALDLTVGDGTWTTRAAMSRFTLLGNLTGHPSVSIPWGHDRAGGGVGVQLMGAHADEPGVLGIAHALEQGRVPT